MRAELGVERVDLVAHSQGGLSTRWYIAFGGGKETVRDYVSLAGVHHGNDNGCFISTTGAKEVCPAYATDLGTVQGKLNGDPTNKDVDETPFGVEEGGSIHWHAFWSDIDLVIRPANSECLDQSSKKDCSAKLNEKFSIAHTDFPKNKDVLKALLAHLRAHNATKP